MVYLQPKHNLHQMQAHMCTIYIRTSTFMNIALLADSPHCPSSTLCMGQPPLLLTWRSLFWWSWREYPSTLVPGQRSTVHPWLLNPTQRQPTFHVTCLHRQHQNISYIVWHTIHGVDEYCELPRFTLCTYINTYIHQCKITIAKLRTKIHIVKGKINQNCPTIKCGDNMFNGTKKHLFQLPEPILVVNFHTGQSDTKKTRNK